MDKSTVMKNYRFLALMLFAMVAGCVAGWFFPEFGHFIKPAGTVFINMMFCVVVPLVFASISNSVASVRSRKRAGKIMGTTVLTFVVTGAVAAVIMFIVMKLVPPVLEPWTDMATEAIGEHASLADMIVNFFTTDDFVGLLSRSAMLPLTRLLSSSTSIPLYIVYLYIELYIGYLYMSRGRLLFLSLLLALPRGSIYNKNRILLPSNKSNS